ncbi:tyrosine-type recombinase/integrase [Actinomadura sp. ATCC 39365]
MGDLHRSRGRRRLAHQGTETSHPASPGTRHGDRKRRRARHHPQGHGRATKQSTHPATGRGSAQSCRIVRTQRLRGAQPHHGIRTEEARALRWNHVVAWTPSLKQWQPVTEAGSKHKKFAIYIRRTVREGADTKTRKSPRTLELPKPASQAPRQHHTRQAAHKLKAGEAWEDHDLVFCTNAGTQPEASNVRRTFREIAKQAGPGTTWSPRELRHSFVSIMSDQGVPTETIADLAGHAGTSVTKAVYHHQLRPVITKGAQTMNTIFGEKPTG